MEALCFTSQVNNYFINLGLQEREILYTLWLKDQQKCVEDLQTTQESILCILNSK